MSSHAIRPRKPVIVVNIDDDRLGRGDTVGRSGIGQALARLLGGHYLFASTSSLAQAFPHIDTPPAGLMNANNKRLTALLAPYGKADFVLGRPLPTELTHHDELTEGDFNECLSSEINLSVVSHNITPDVLITAGAAFDRAYPYIKGPLIAVLAASPSEDEIFYQKLASIAATYDHATIFLCGCHRTKEKVLNDAVARLQDHCAEKGKGRDITILSYKYADGDPRNPYRGLIARADHFVIWGDSKSLMSEPLVRGKMIHVHAGYRYGMSDMIANGYAADLQDIPDGEPFPVKTFSPVNVTERVAQSLIDKKKRIALRRKDQNLRNSKNLTRDQHHFLKHVAADASAITRLPARYKSSPHFVRAAAAVNPHVLPYLGPAARRDARLVLRAAINDARCLPHAHKSLLRDKPFVLRLLRDAMVAQIPDIYAALPPALREDLTVCIQAARRTAGIEFFMTPEWLTTVYRNEDYALAAASSCISACTRIGKNLLADTAFIEKLCTVNPRALSYLPPEHQVCPRKAQAYFKSAFREALAQLHPDARDNDTIARMAIKASAANGRHISGRLKGSIPFYRSLKGKSLSALRYADDSVRADKRTMMRAVSYDPDLYDIADDTLLKDPLFIIYTLKALKRKDLPVDRLIRRIPPALVERPSFVIQLMRHHKNALCDIGSARRHYDGTSAGQDLARRLAAIPYISWKHFPLWFIHSKPLMQTYAAHRPAAAAHPELREYLGITPAPDWSAPPRRSPSLLPRFTALAVPDGKPLPVPPVESPTAAPALIKNNPFAPARKSLKCPV